MGAFNNIESLKKVWSQILSFFLIPNSFFVLSFFFLLYFTTIIWEIFFFVLLLEILLAILVDRHYHRTIIRLFGTQSFFGFNLLLRKITSLFNRPEAVKVNEDFSLFLNAVTSLVRRSESIKTTEDFIFGLKKVTSLVDRLDVIKVTEDFKLFLQKVTSLVDRLDVIKVTEEFILLFKGIISFLGRGKTTEGFSLALKKMVNSLVVQLDLRIDRGTGEPLVGDFFSTREFKNYNEEVKSFNSQILNVLFISCGPIIFFHFFLVILSLQNSLTYTNFFLMLPYITFGSIFFIHLFRLKRNYSHLQMLLLHLNKYFDELDFTFTGIDVNQFCTGDTIVLEGSRELLKGYLENYSKSVKTLTKVLSETKFINLCLSVLIVVSFFYIGIFIFRLSLIFFYNVFFTSNLITEAGIALVIFTAFVICFLLYSDAKLVFHHNSKLLFEDYKRIEVKDALRAS